MSVDQPLARWNLSETIPVLQSMPILSRWLEGAAEDQPLEGITALMLQHQLGNHVPQTEVLIHLGIKPADIYWIDIPYTSTAVVRDALMLLGIPERNFLTGNFRLLDDYAPYQRLRVQQFMRELAQAPPDHLLVLDDGSYLLEALACQRHSLPRISIVEQTTRGMIKIEENAALWECATRVPIVNVARSDPKMTLEPPFIGVAVCDALRRRVGAKLSPRPMDRCLLLGYGSIGEQVAAFVHRSLGFAKERIHVFDTDGERVLKAKAAGFTPWSRKEREHRFRLVIGCSGRASFRVGDHVLLEDGAYLVSATSGTVELSREQFVELAEASPYDDIWIVKDDLDQSNLHSDLEFHFIDRHATFVNGGFPVNFDGRVNCVPAHYIQPTPTMMCAAAVQAVQTSKRGIIELDDGFCSWVAQEFHRELGDESWLIVER